MRKSIKTNYIYNLSYQLLAIIIPIVTTPYLSRTLGSSSIGIFSFTNSITAYFIMFGALGIYLYGQREIAYNQNNKKELSVIFWELFFLKLISMAIVTIVYYFIFSRNGEFSIYYKFLLFQLFGSAIDIGWLFQGLEDFRKITIRNLIIKILTVALIFLFIKKPEDLTKYIIIYSASIFLGNFVLWLNLKKLISKISLKELNVKRHIKPTLTLFVPQIAIQIYVLLDKTMIGVITDNMSEVGYYEQSQKIVKILLTIVTSIGIVMLPRISNYFSIGKHKEIKHYIEKSFNFVLIMIFPMVIGLISISKSFVPVFYGSGFEKIIILLPLMSLIIIPISISSIIGTQFLLPTKRVKEYTISVIFGAFINFIINVLLIKSMLSIGACISTVIAEFTVVFVQIWFVRKIFDFKKIFKKAIKYFILSLIMLLFTYPINYIGTNNILTITIQLIVGVIIYIVALIIVNDDFFKTYFLIISKRIKKLFLKRA